MAGYRLPVIGGNVRCAPASSYGMQQRMQKRLRFKHEKTFEERLAEQAQRFKEAAEALPPGTARELLLTRARQAETASHINNWLRSPGRQPPQVLENLVSDQKK